VVIFSLERLGGFDSHTSECQHFVFFLAGDRSEPHLEHAARGLLAAIQSLALDPDLNEADFPGPGCRVTERMAAVLCEKRHLRAERRDENLEPPWETTSIPEIVWIIQSRPGVLKSGSHHTQSRSRSRRAPRSLPDSQVLGQFSIPSNGTS